MVKRVFDILASSLAILVLSPLFLLAAIGIRISSPGPVFFRGQRAGRDGQPFLMHKFRTMSVQREPRASSITASCDARVFPFGQLLRRLKIDELPQLYDVLRGVMSIVGPRPEDFRVVRDHYAPEHWETLAVRPGLASPGSIFNYTHAERLIGSDQPERDYLEKVLPLKLALERVYVQRAGMAYDLQIISRTVAVILLMACGKRQFRDPPEMAAVDNVVPARLGNSSPHAGFGITPTE